MGVSLRQPHPLQDRLVGGVELAQEPYRFLQRHDGVVEVTDHDLCVRQIGLCGRQAPPFPGLPERLDRGCQRPAHAVHVGVVAMQEGPHQPQHRPCPWLRMGQPPIDRRQTLGGIVEDQREGGLDQGGSGVPADRLGDLDPCPQFFGRYLRVDGAAGEHAVEQVEARGDRPGLPWRLAGGIQRESQQARRLGMVALDRPEQAERRPQPHSGPGIAGVAGEVQGRQQVVTFGGEPGDPWDLAGPPQPRLGSFRKA